MTKTCSKCKKNKSLSEYYKNGRKSKEEKYCFKSWCKLCDHAYQRNFKKRKRNERTPHETKEYNRKHFLKTRYRIDDNDYEKMLSDQGSVCAICKNPETMKHSSTGNPRHLSVDHCHKSGEVRGLLCHKCNTALGSFKDDPDLIRSAIDYLEKHRV